MTPPVPDPAGEAPDLKACPFCGSPAKLYPHVVQDYAGCANLDCLAEMLTLPVFKWNRRASGAPGRDAPSEESDIERLVRSAAERGQLVHLDAGLLLDLFRQLRASRGLPAPPLNSWHRHGCKVGSAKGQHDPCYCVCGATSMDRGQSWLEPAGGLPAAPPERIATEIIGKNNGALRARIAELEAALADFTEFFMGEDLEGPQYDSWVRARTALGEGRPE